MKPFTRVHAPVVVSLSMFLTLTPSQVGGGSKQEIGKSANVAATARVSTKAPKARTCVLDFYKGVNYVSWTVGDYPYTSAWKRQTYNDSQGYIALTIPRPARRAGARN